jgi:hypothetical protein
MNKAAQQLGRLGGKVKGPSKARTPEQARAASKARWDKVRAAKAAAEGGKP